MERTPYPHRFSYFPCTTPGTTIVHRRLDIAVVCAPKTEAMALFSTTTIVLGSAFSLVYDESV